MYQEIKELSREELLVRLEEAQRSYYQMREDVMTAKESNHAQLKDLRRSIARFKTRLQEI